MRARTSASQACGSARRPPRSEPAQTDPAGATPTFAFWPSSMTSHANAWQ
jgi:hypothetical protein